jgi:hypothetical protein
MKRALQKSWNSTLITVVSQHLVALDIKINFSFDHSPLCNMTHNIYTPHSLKATGIPHCIATLFTIGLLLPQPA